MLQTRILRGLLMADRLTFEPSVLGFVFEDMIDDTSQFFGNDCTGNRFIGAAKDLLVQSPVLGIVLNGTDGHIGKSDLEIFVAVLAAGFVPYALVGVLCAGYQTAVGDEVLVGDETLDAIGLKIDGEGRGFTNAGYPDQALDVVVGDEDRLEKMLQREDLSVQQIDLLIEMA